MTCPARIEDLFTLELPAADAHVLYEHLDGCESCRAKYDRRLLFESLLPPDERTSPEKRIRTTLPFNAPFGLSAGLRPDLRFTRSRSLARRWQGALAVLAAAACLLLVFHRRNADEGFSARGNALAEGPSLEIYRLRGGSTLATDSIAPDDELAFAYTNPEAKKYLLVFAVDEERRVYWYYPAWTKTEEAPTAVAIEPTRTLVELGEGIRHSFQGRRIRIYAVWSDARLTTRDVEARLAESGSPPLPERLGWPGTVERSRALEVH